MRPEDFDYRLPEELIAQHPLENRDASRMLTLNRQAGSREDHFFGEFPNLLHGDELVVLNNARVIPARLFGRRVGVHSDPPSRATRHEHLSGKVEVLLTRQTAPDTWDVLVHPGQKMRTGERVLFGSGELEAEVVARGDFGQRTVKLVSHDSQPVGDHINRLGHIPLPPYIHREDEPGDRERYQTVFASHPGAVAAPTAGLHFTAAILQAIRQRGIEVCELTLHVGLGTFQPVRTEKLEDHVMHSEAYEIPAETAERINAAHAAKRPILAVGTTVVRALEDAAARTTDSDSHQLVRPGIAEARLFIFPGFRFRAVNALLTNFHLPRSTLLALVCAFAGREHVLAAYEHAVRSRYRFYSYGDCMLIR